MGDYFKQELLDSYAVLNVKELFDPFVIDSSQYELALENLEILYPRYSLIKRVHCLDLKKVDNIFTRYNVYQLNKDKLEDILEILKDSLEQKECSIISEDIALEIISRIYFAMTPDRKLDIDSKIIDFLKNERNLRGKSHIKNSLENLLERIMFDKNKLEQEVFCENLFSLDINSQWQEDKSLYKHDFFEPFLIVFSKIKDIDSLSISENKILELIENLKANDDESIKEISLIRLTFLAETNSLPEIYRKEFVDILKVLPKNKGQGISEFIFNNVFDKITNESTDVSSDEIEIFLSKDIPKFVSTIKGLEGIGYSNTLLDYFKELYGVFPDCIAKKFKRLPTNEYYKSWLIKFYEWWNDQEEGLLRNIEEGGTFLQLPDYLKSVVICLKNNILSVAPLEVFDDRDFEKLTRIFKKIDSYRPDLSLYLVPSFERLTIPNKYSLTDIVNSLKSKDQSIVQQALHCLYDYLAFIDNQEIELDSKNIKTELFSMLYYSTDSTFESTVDTFKYILKNISNVFTEEEYLSLQKFVNEFLSLINSSKITFKTLGDFKTISSMAGLVAYLSRSEVINTSEDLKDWVKYIENHRLPEVREYRDWFY